MLEKLTKLNPGIKFYSIHDEEFEKYGVVLDVDTTELLNACKDFSIPKSGNIYEPSVEKLEELNCSKLLGNILFGGCETETGICLGQNSTMNAMEYHKSSEINVAITPLVIILGLKSDIKNNEYCGDNAVAFYAEQGSAFEMYSTTLHYCPCQALDEGFFSVVVLPKDTNTPLEGPSSDKLLLSKNKWIICHKECNDLIETGIYPGIYGTNHIIIF